MIVWRHGRDRRLKHALDAVRAFPSRALARAGIRRAVLYERMIPELDQGATGSFSHRWVEHAGVRELAEASGRDAAEQLARIARGERCLATFEDERPVAFRWVATGTAEIPFLRIRARLPADTVWVYDSWTDPTRRGRGAATAATHALGAALRAEGSRRTLAIVMRGNRPGASAVLRAGYHPLGTITTLRTRRGRLVRFRRGRARGSERPPAGSELRPTAPEAPDRVPEHGCEDQEPHHDLDPVPARFVARREERPRVAE